MRQIPRPLPGEYAPYTVEYFDLVPGDDVLAHMHECLTSTVEFFAGVDPSVLDRPHAPGEWTVKEIVQHISDDERIYGYRALRFARNDAMELPGFEQDPFAAHSMANSRSVDSLLREYVTFRQASISLFDGLPDEALTRAGVASGNSMSVRAAAYHIAGHELHHIESVRRNYLGA